MNVTKAIIAIVLMFLFFVLFYFISEFIFHEFIFNCKGHEQADIIFSYTDGFLLTLTITLFLVKIYKSSKYP